MSFVHLLVKRKYLYTDDGARCNKVDGANCNIYVFLHFVNKVFFFSCQKIIVRVGYLLAIC